MLLFDSKRNTYNTTSYFLCEFNWNVNEKGYTLCGIVLNYVCVNNRIWTIGTGESGIQSANKCSKWTIETL